MALKKRLSRDKRRPPVPIAKGLRLRDPVRE
jgi:hypothetical protein